MYPLRSLSSTDSEEFLPPPPHSVRRPPPPRPSEGPHGFGRRLNLLEAAATDADDSDGRGGGRRRSRLAVLAGRLTLQMSASLRWILTEIAKLLVLLIESLRANCPSPAMIIFWCANWLRERLNRPPQSRTRRDVFRSTPGRLAASAVGAPRLNILLCGLPRAGKSSLLYKMKLDSFIPMMPTVETVVEHFDLQLGEEPHQTIRLQMRDLGRRKAHAPPWTKDDIWATDCVIFVIDGKDRARVAEARAEIFEVMFEDHYRLVDGRFLILVNKQDVGSSMSRKEVESLLALPNELRDKWRVIGSSAATGQGVWEGLRWLAATSYGGYEIRDWRLNLPLDQQLLNQANSPGALDASTRPGSSRRDHHTIEFSEFHGGRGEVDATAAPPPPRRAAATSPGGDRRLAFLSSSPSDDDDEATKYYDALQAKLAAAPVRPDTPGGGAGGVGGGRSVNLREI